MSAQIYGTLEWSTINAPKPFSGICEGFNYRKTSTVGEETNEHEDIIAVPITQIKGEGSFEGKVTDASTDLPDLSSGAKISISGLTDGTVLARQLVETWRKGQTKTYQVQFSHFPNVTGGDGANAGSLTGFTPSPQVAPPIVRPADKIIFGVKGLTSTLGKVEGLTITQTLQLREYTDESEQIFAVVAVGYKREFQLEVLANAAAALPDENDSLAVSGAPSNASAAFVTSAEERWRKGDAKMISVNAMWFANQGGGS